MTSTYQKLRSLWEEEPRFFQAPDELYRPYARKIVEAHHQVAKDHLIPWGEDPVDRQTRIKAFEDLPSNTELSKKAAQLLQEALAMRETLLASIQTHKV